MNNKIDETYCSFAVSKLLKEKGFEIPCIMLVDEFEHLMNDGSYYEYKFPSPTHALAIEWIRINLGQWIYVVPQTLLGKRKCDTYYHTIVGDDITHSDFYNSPAEATEAALLYILKQ